MGLVDERRNAQLFATHVMDGVKQTMYGMDGVIQLAVIALFIKKHILLEGNPGLGKTSLVNAIAGVMSLDFRRIQFTPDLLPSDILITPRTEQINGQTTFVLDDGPIFTNLLLADEINRATQKTQAALLEAMGERQVTINGVTKRLDVEGAPFMVLATQNPVDHEGTYDLPEAQLDRFVFKVLMPTPGSTALREILVKTAGLLNHDGQSAAKVTAPPSEGKGQTILRFNHYHQLIREIPVSPSAQAHIENLFHATNNNFAAVQVGRNQEQLQKLVKMMRYGLGPRAATDLVLSAKAFTLFFGAAGMKLNTDADVVVNHEALAQIALPVLRHRVRLSYSGQEAFSRDFPATAGQSVIDTFVYHLLLACVPSGTDFEPSYGARFRDNLTEMLKRQSF